MEKLKDGVWYYYDPDNRKPDPLGLHCIRCKKKFRPGKRAIGFVTVVLHPDNPWIMKAPKGTHITELRSIGPECINRLTEITI